MRAHQHGGRRDGRGAAGRRRARRRAGRPAIRSGRRRSRRGPDPEAGDRDRARRARRDDRRVRPLPAGRRRRVARVAGGLAAHVVEGRELRYAIVGQPERVTPKGLERVRAAAAKLIDPRNAAARRAAIAARDPASCGSPATSTAARRAAPTRRSGALGLADRADCAADADPRQRDRRDPPDPEPGRPRGRHPPQRLRLRHEPRLVRAHAARDRRQARAAPALPAGAVHRRPRDGPPGLLLPAQRRPDLPRDHRHRSTGSTTSTARRCRGVRRAQGSPTSTTTVTTSSTWLRRHRARTGFGAAGMTFEKASGDRIAARAHEQYLRSGRRCPRPRRASARARGLARLLGRGAAAGPGRRARPNEVVEPTTRSSSPVPDITVRHYFLRADAGRRGSCRRWCGGSSAWTSRCGG